MTKLRFLCLPLFALSCSVAIAKDSTLDKQLISTLKTRGFLATSLSMYSVYDRNLRDDSGCATSLERSNGASSFTRWGEQVVVSADGMTRSFDRHSGPNFKENIQLPSGSQVMVEDVRVKDDRIELSIMTEIDGACKHTPQILLMLDKGFASTYHIEDILNRLSKVLYFPQYSEPPRLNAEYETKKEEIQRRVLSYPSLSTTEDKLQSASEIHNGYLEIVKNRQRLTLILGTDAPDLRYATDKAAEWASTEATLRVQASTEEGEAARRDAELKAQEQARQKPAQGPAREIQKSADATAAPEEMKDAEYRLSQRLAEGNDIKKDPVRATYWLKKAAEDGNAKAQFALGLAYSKGDGVEKDSSRAAIWFLKAAELGNPEATNELAKLSHEGQGFTKDLAPAVVDARAQLALGLAYSKGEGVAKDTSQAAIWFRKAAELGNAEAQSQLGVCYYSGQGVPRDAVAAATWFRKAAEQGDSRAQYSLGLLYMLGDGVSQDIPKAKFWFMKASAQGDKDAQLLLSRMEQDGQDGKVVPAQKQSKRDRQGKQIELEGYMLTFDPCTMPGAKVAAGETPESFSMMEKLHPSLAASLEGLKYLCDPEKSDYAKAAQLFGKSLLLNDASGALFLAYMNLHGVGMRQDLLAGLRYLALNNCLLSGGSMPALAETRELRKFLSPEQMSRAHAILHDLDAAGCSVSALEYVLNSPVD